MDFTVASIGCSVGTGGVNRRGDVKTVQKLLNEHILGDPAFRQAVDGLSGMEGQILIEDGISGPRTEGCIRQFQLTVMRKSERWADGRVDPPAGRNTAATWKALNGNVATMSDLAPTYLSDEVMGAVESALGNCGPYVPFRQGDYGAHLGPSTRYDSDGDDEITENDRFSTIARHGCCLCTLTMAATAIGARVPPHWPTGLSPANLTPLKANEICKSAGAFSGYFLIINSACQALGMDAEHYGFDPVDGANLPLPDNARDVLLGHLALGYPVAAHVDYRGGDTGDHWVLITETSNAGLADAEALDPASGATMWFTSVSMINDRYWDVTMRSRRGVLFGIPGSAGDTSHNQRTKQGKYIVTRFATLSPATAP